MNLYYGSLHFIVPIVVLIVLFRRWPADYRLWRNTLAATTALALIGFSLFPLMPPRLLCDCTYGAGPGFHYGFVDTLVALRRLVVVRLRGHEGRVQPVRGHAQPPHRLVAVVRLRPGAPAPPTWAKALAALYPVVTLLAIVVTANHYFLDAVGGAAVLAVGFLIGRGITRHRRPAPPARR